MFMFCFVCSLFVIFEILVEYDNLSNIVVVSHVASCVPMIALAVSVASFGGVLGLKDQALVGPARFLLRNFRFAHRSRYFLFS